MHKSQRLVQLIMKVNERKRFTIQEMADECGVSRRTMIRDLMELSELGVPLYSEAGANGGYRVLQEKVLPPISFTENEALALFFAGQSLRNYNSLPFHNEVDSALDKFLHYLSTQLKQKIARLQQRLVFWVAPHELEVPFLQALLEAAIQQQVVAITYEAATLSERSIQPLLIYSANGLWYCQAFCFLAEDYRIFRIDRIKSFSVEADQSARKDIAQQNINVWETNTDELELLKLEVDLTAEGIRRCQSDTWLAKSISLHEDGTGTIYSSISPTSVTWAAHLFLGFGTEANVKQPLILREQIQAKLKALTEQYKQ